MYSLSVFRRLALAASAALLIVSCSSDGCGSESCKEGITFYVAEVAGSLARGTTEPLHICFDTQCKDVTITRENAGGSVFLEFSGVGKAGSHDLTVQGTGAFSGQYTGELATFEQKPNGSACPGSCALASVKIGSDGTLTPGVPAQQATATTATPAGTPTTTG
jgi:hypothetical protein